jgi:hypothetical protein
MAKISSALRSASDLEELRHFELLNDSGRNRALSIRLAAALARILCQVERLQLTPKRSVKPQLQCLAFQE